MRVLLVLNIAHRGASGTFPENTLVRVPRRDRRGRGYVRAGRAAHRDGALVVIHDETVDRTTDGAARSRSDACGVEAARRRRAVRRPVRRRANPDARRSVFRAGGECCALNLELKSGGRRARCAEIMQARNAMDDARVELRLGGARNRAPSAAAIRTRSARRASGRRE